MSASVHDWGGFHVIWTLEGDSFQDTYCISVFSLIIVLLAASFTLHNCILLLCCSGRSFYVSCETWQNIFFLGGGGIIKIFVTFQIQKVRRWDKKPSCALFTPQHTWVGFHICKDAKRLKEKELRSKEAYKTLSNMKRGTAAGCVCARRRCDAASVKKHPPPPPLCSPHFPHLPPASLLGPNSEKHHRRRQLQRGKLHLSD